MAAPWHTGNSEEAIEESDGITSCFWGFSPPSPPYLIGWQSTTPPQSPPVFLPWSGFRPWSNALSFSNRERSMQLQQQLLEEWSDVFNCAAGGGIPQQQQLQQLQYWIQVLDFVEKGTTTMINWWEQGSRGPRGEWVAKTRVRPKRLKKRKKVKRPCIGGTFDTTEEVASRDGEKFRMKGEKARLNFPKLFLKIADPHLSDGDSELTQQLLQEWRNNAFDFEAIGIFELLQYWSYALNFAVKGLLMTLNGLQPIMNSREHRGEWVVKIRLRRSRHGNGGLDIRDVWMSNFRNEMARIDSRLGTYNMIEFPGFLRNTPWEASEEARYRDLKFNVDRLKPIQLGLTVFNNEGRIGGSWQFNFNDFDVTTDLQVGASIRLIATYTPDSVVEFAKKVGEVLGSVYDVKFMAKYCNGLMDGLLGLEKLSKILMVERVGAAHQAGSDSLLTARVFSKMVGLWVGKASVRRVSVWDRYQDREQAAVLQCSAAKRFYTLCKKGYAKRPLAQRGALRCQGSYVS
ncbi:hypothetical protein RHGRI_000614 [Rhododendron griersonianum]|uniref:Uncharacterized protein n=1 Tax=Rhododendron griersonianum TaxID=479676 RepID=A0AAV6LHB9_9ERIC|nr:hypothetical protein RHGRI_000614 [Rhododendron griersonianum]